jgi:predicted phage terminase large subunit-like protein
MSDQDGLQGLVLDDESADQLAASICREKFYFFVQEFWETIIEENPVWNWHIPLLCDEMQAVAERVFQNKPKEYDLIINVPPGSTKSTLCSVMFPAWVQTRHSSQCICGSYADKLAFDLGRKSRDVVMSEKYQRYFPEISLRKDRCAISDFGFTKGGWRVATGAGGIITGFHGHFVIVDDPLDPQAALSDADIKTINSWMNETLPSRKVEKWRDPTILIMQRLHQNDPTGNWLNTTKGKGIRHLCLPAEDSDLVQPPELRKLYVDGLMDPIRLPHTVLDAQKLRGEYAYAGQFMQNPVPPGGGMFKIDRVRLGRPPDRFARLVRYWDKAYTFEGGAYTVGCKMGVVYEGTLPHFWILDIVRGQWDSDRRERIIRATAEMDGIETEIGVEEEPAAGKQSAEGTVRNLAGFRVKANKANKDKTLRADPFAAQFNGGRVSIAIGPWNHDYLEELRYFPFSTYKDQVDASSGAFDMLARPQRIVGVY